MMGSVQSLAGSCLPQARAREGRQANMEHAVGLSSQLEMADFIVVYPLRVGKQECINEEGEKNAVLR